MDIQLGKDTQSLKAYEERMQVLWIALYFMLQGLNLDKQKKKAQLDGIDVELLEAQKEMDLVWLDTKMGKKALQKANEDREKLIKQKEEYEQKQREIREEITRREEEGKAVTKKLLGDELVCGRQIVKLVGKIEEFEWPSFNAKSWPMKEKLMYSVDGLGMKKPKSKSDSATEELLIIKNLTNKQTKEWQREVLQKLLVLIKLRTTKSDIEKLTVDPLDGRLRCSYSVAGPVSGRWSNSESNIPEQGYKTWQ
jgi:hypothetical protein